MRIAIIATYTHPTRLPGQGALDHAVRRARADRRASAPPDAQIELYNEKEDDIPSTATGTSSSSRTCTRTTSTPRCSPRCCAAAASRTVAGGRHAGTSSRTPSAGSTRSSSASPRRGPGGHRRLRARELQPVYPWRRHPGRHPGLPLRPHRLLQARYACPASRPAAAAPSPATSACSPGTRSTAIAPWPDVIATSPTHMRWNKSTLRHDGQGVHLLRQQPRRQQTKYLRELCEALIPHKLIWGCSLTFNILEGRGAAALDGQGGLPLHLHGPGVLQPRVHRGDEQGPEQARRGPERTIHAGLRPRHLGPSACSSAPTATRTSTSSACPSCSSTCASSRSPSSAS
jgi:hypothetical protein